MNGRSGVPACAAVSRRLAVPPPLPGQRPAPARLLGLAGGLTVLLATLALTAPAALAAYPERPVTLIVPYAAGGPMDKLARQVAAQLNPLLKQTVVVVNQGGAGGNIGTAAAKRAAPDGYTLLLDHVHMATAPSLYRKLDVDPVNDFEPLGVIAESPLVLIARPDVPAASLGDLLRWMARQPQVTLANAGVGSASHLCGLLLQNALKIRMTTVPYRGTGPAMIDMLSGQVDLMCDLTANALPQIQAAKVQAVALTVDDPLTGYAARARPVIAIVRYRSGAHHDLVWPVCAARHVQRRRADRVVRASRRGGVAVVPAAAAGRRHPAGRRQPADTAGPSSIPAG